MASTNKIPIYNISCAFVLSLLNFGMGTDDAEGDDDNRLYCFTYRYSALFYLSSSSIEDDCIKIF